MKLIVFTAIIAGVICVGFYQGWFHLGSESSAGQSDVTLTVDKDKMKADEQAAKSKLEGLGRKTEVKAAAAVDAAEQAK